jgi:hypothetical protein
MKPHYLPFVAVIFIVTFLAFLLSTCTVNLQDKIIGKWADTSGGQQSWEFFHDGTVTFTILGTPVIGKYTFTGQSTISIEMPNILGGTITDEYTVDIEDDRLSLTTSGVSVYYKKIK